MTPEQQEERERLVREAQLRNEISNLKFICGFLVVGWMLLLLVVGLGL